MSFWSYVRGMIEVYPMGRTQAEMRYILETVLSHLPPVTGSEGNMKAHIVQKSGFNYSSSADEFGQDTGMGNSHYGRFFDTQSCYFLVVEGDLRDRLFDHAYEEFQKWLCRLAKRVRVKDVMVKSMNSISIYSFRMTKKNILKCMKTHHGVKRVV